MDLAADPHPTRRGGRQHSLSPGPSAHHPLQRRTGATPKITGSDSATHLPDLAAPSPFDEQGFAPLISYMISRCRRPGPQLRPPTGFVMTWASSAASASKNRAL